MLKRGYKVRLELEAEQDLADALKYYEGLSHIAARNFIKSFRETSKSIARMPFHQIRYDSIRCFKIKRFPYLLHYFVNEQSKEVFIQGVWHERRNTPLGSIE